MVTKLSEAGERDPEKQLKFLTMELFYTVSSSLCPDYYSEQMSISCLLKLEEGVAHPDGAFSWSSKVGLKTKVTSIDVMNSTESVTMRKRDRINCPSSKNNKFFSYRIQNNPTLLSHFCSNP